MKTEKLIAAYRQAVILNYTASETGRARKANRAYDRIERLMQQVRRGGPEIQRAFLTLLEDEEIPVRAAAAGDALEFAPEQALPVLRQIAAEGPWPINLYVKWQLEQWEAGTLPQK